MFVTPSELAASAQGCALSHGGRIQPLSCHGWVSMCWLNLAGSGGWKGREGRGEGERRWIGVGEGRPEGGSGQGGGGSRIQHIGKILTPDPGLVGPILLVMYW